MVKKYKNKIGSTFYIHVYNLTNQEAVIKIVWQIFTYFNFNRLSWEILKNDA